MYLRHFAFKRLPFETPAETDELFESNARREAEARLGHLIDLRGIGMLTGEVGSGKTTVCRHLTAQLHPGLYRVYYVSLTTGNVLDMYKSIAWEIGIAVERSRSSALEGKSGSGQMALFPEDREAPELACEVVRIAVKDVELRDPRQWGACWLALVLWDRLDLDRFWGPRLPPSRQGTRWLDILKILACYRLIDPGSEWRLHRHWYEHSALRDLLGCDRAIADDTLYRWSVVATQFPSILGVMLIMLICIVLNASALELATGADMDMNRDFRAEGAACPVAGLGGSAPGCNTAAITMISHTTGAETRLTGIVVAFSVGAILIFGGDLLAMLPTQLLGGLVLYIGLGLLNDWLVGSRKTLPWTDYGIVLVISLVIGVFGFIEGVGVGLVAAVIFFVVRFSGVDVIGTSFTARDRHSKRTRSATHRAILGHNGERVHAHRLRGYIIFGNASPLGDRLKQALNADPPPLCLLLDFAAVSGFDVSAANIMFRSVRTAHARGTRIVLSAMAEHVRSILRRGLPASEWRNLMFEEDIDRGLERCEDLVIAEWDRPHAGSEDARDALFGLSIDHAVHELERQVRFEALSERLGPWLRDRSYAAGETIVARGAKQEGMQLLTQV